MSMRDYELYESEPALSAVEQSVFDAVSSDVPWSLVEQFAELERVSGSEDERRAAEALETRLDGMGIDHVRFEPELYLSVPESASLTANGESFDAVKTVAFGGGTATGELVVVDADDNRDTNGEHDANGDGKADGDTEADSKYDTDNEHDTDDELLGAELGDISDVEGKIALLRGVLPIEAIEQLEAAGAAGVLVQHPHEREPHDGIATPVWGGAPTPGSDLRPPEIPICTIAAPVGRQLRELDAPTVGLTARTTTGWKSCPLVHARITPDDTDETDWDDADKEFVLLHGHYDSWHVGVADNATGDAALVELARVFEAHSDELNRELWVCWWPGHSTGRYAGSTWFADQYAGTLRDQCITQVNVDSPGAVDATEFEDMVVWMPAADQLCRNAIADVCGKDATQNRPPRAGDYSFTNLGVTGAFMLSSNIPEAVRDERGYHTVGGCGGHSDAWHLTTDTLDKADPDVLVRDIRVYAVALTRLLRAETVPLDLRATIDNHRATLAAYDDASAFDLSPVRTAAATAESAIESLYAAVEADEIEPATANAAIRTAASALVRVNFTTDGPFEHDPAYDRPPYPGLQPATTLSALDDDERNRQVVELRRQRNRAVALLEQATQAARRGESATR